MNQLARTNEVWLDRDNKILSFHYVKDYLHKQFRLCFIYQLCCLEQQIGLQNSVINNN